MSNQDTHGRSSASGEQIGEEAAEWYLRLASRGSDSDGEPRTLARNAQFQEWCKRSPEHVRAFLEICEVDCLTRRLATKVPTIRRASLSKVFLALAASLVALVAPLPNEALRAAPQFYSTGIGERQTVQLEDGTSVILNTNSRVSVLFTPRAREIRLLWGEALFDVRHDTERPFRVISDGVLLEDLGTQFNVYNHRDGVSISVIDGRVHLFCNCTTAFPRTPVAGAHPPLTPPSVSESLGPSEAAEVTHTQSADVFFRHPLSPSARDDTIAWRNGIILLDNLTLAKAVDEFNRYSKEKLTIADPSIESHIVGGRFDGPDIDSFLMELSVTYGIRSVRRGSGSEFAEVRLFGKTGVE